MGEGKKQEMTWIEKYAQERCAKSPEFKAAYEEESALLALVRARNKADLTQQDVADALHVSQPYIAQIERGSKPLSASMMFRYASVVGVSIQITAQP